MSPITPFRPPPPRPLHSSSTRSNAGPQFASTPRFIFSQQKQSNPILDQDGIDANESPSTARRSDTRQSEVIEDAGDDEQNERERGASRPAKDGIFDEELDSSPPELEAEVDPEFEDLFAAPADRAKRRRISLDGEAVTPLQVRPRDDAILTSSPGTESWNEPPVTPFPRRLGPHQNAAVSMMGTRKLSTPVSAKPSFRHNPRFMLFANVGQQEPFSSQARTPSTPAAAAPQTPISSQRRKPAFVLPRSPSPSSMDADAASLPTPFSPSSRTLHRRGRARSAAPGYQPGGMAAEVRGWVLEMGTRREQLEPSPGRPSSLIDTKRYLVTARITKVRQTALGSSGPLAFVETQLAQAPTSALPSSTSEDADAGETRRNILLMGFPPFRSELPELRVDHTIGVYRGLVWEIRLDKDGVNGLLGKGCPIPAGLTDYDTNATDSETWLVVMEWDILQ